MESSVSRPNDNRSTMQLMRSPQIMELPGDPVLRLACFIDVRLVMDKHDSAVARTGNLGQLSRLNMFCISAPVNVDTRIGIEEQIVGCIRLDISHHGLSRQPPPLPSLGQHRRVGQPTKLRIVRDNKPTTGRPATHAAEQHRVNNPLVRRGYRAKQHAVGILESVAEEFCMSHEQVQSSPLSVSGTSSVRTD